MAVLFQLNAPANIALRITAAKQPKNSKAYFLRGAFPIYTVPPRESFSNIPDNSAEYAAPAVTAAKHITADGIILGELAAMRRTPPIAQKYGAAQTRTSPNAKNPVTNSAAKKIAPMSS